MLEDIFGCAAGYSAFELRLPNFDTLLYNSQFKLSGKKIKCHKCIIAQQQLIQDKF